MLSSQVDDIAAHVKGDLAVIGDLQLIGELYIAREADNIHRIVRQSRFQLCLIRYGSVQPAGEDEFIGDGGAGVPLHVVLVPAIEGVAEFCRVGQGDFIAGLHDLRGVVLVAVEVVLHGDAADPVFAICDAAVECAAGDAAAIVSINPHGVRATSASRAADDLHIAADGERSGVGDAASAQNYTAFRMAVPNHRRTGQSGASNITSHFAIIADAAAESIPILIGGD